MASEMVLETAESETVFQLFSLIEKAVYGPEVPHPVTPYLQSGCPLCPALSRSQILSRHSWPAIQFVFVGCHSGHSSAAMFVEAAS
jgi:hypothetical protein